MARILILGLFLLPFFAEAAPRNFKELAGLAINIINGGIGIALILGIVIYFGGIASNLRSVGSGEAASTLRTHLLWGIIALFVMFSVWGIVGLLRNTLFGGGGGGFNSGSTGGGQVFCETIDCTNG